MEWIKKGLVFEPKKFGGRPWMTSFAQGPATYITDDFVRVYFSCRPDADANGQYVSYSSFVEFDRKKFPEILRVSDAPVMSLGGLGMFDEFGVYPFTILKDEKAFRAYYGGWTRCESVPFNVAIGVAESRDDGETFERLGQGPVLSYSPDEPFILSGPKIRKFGNTYFLYYISGKKWIVDQGHPEPVYSIRLATSEDGINWTKHNKDLIEVKIEADECQASPDVIFYNGKYHMFFCYRYSRNYRGKEGGYRFGYAVSDDAINWARKDEIVGIDISKDGWDSEMVSYPHVFELDGQMHMLYLGNSVGREGFGWAVLNGELGA